MSAEVGGQCFPGENPAFQSELRSAVGRFDAYVLKNGKNMDPAQVAAFKRSQGGAGKPREFLCQGTPTLVYRRLEAGGTDKVRTMTDQVLARPGEPTWGTCF